MSLRLASLVLCSSILACSRTPNAATPTYPPLAAAENKSVSPPAEPKSATQDWDAFVNELIEASFVRDPGFAAYQGRHEFDGQVPDLSAAGTAAKVAELQQFRERALAFTEAQLDATQRFERDYVVANIDGGLFWLVRMEEHKRSPLVYSNAIDPSLYLTRDYAPLEQRLRAYIAHARSWRSASRCLAGLDLTLRKTSSISLPPSATLR